MSRIIFRDIISILNHYNTHATYTKKYKCKVTCSFHVDCYFRPALNFTGRMYKIKLWEYLKVKEGVYNRVLLGSKWFGTLDETYIFMEKVLRNGCNFDGIELYRNKEKEEIKDG